MVGTPDIVSQLSTLDKSFDFIFQNSAFLRSMANIMMVATIFGIVPFVSRDLDVSRDAEDSKGAHSYYRSLQLEQ